MSAYDELMAFQRQTEALGQVAGRLGWDQETVMPEGAAGQRAEEFAAMESVLHARRTDARIGEWLGKIDADKLDAVGAANIRHITRSYERSQRVPAKLAEAIAKLSSSAQRIWSEARAKEDVAAFLPALKEMISLKREEAAALANGGTAYDALLDDYEPDTSGDDVAKTFAAMRPRLVALRDKVMGGEQPPELAHEFDEQKQMRLARALAKTFGYDMRHGRLDKAVHPFSSGSGQDVRITTRTALTDPFNSIYSTIHETGHATYEQNIAPEHLLTPLGEGVSLGVHESQSRIYENQLGRSRAFTGWLFGQMKDAFGNFGITDEDVFFRTVNRLGKGYIRTEADEVQYNLHIMLRFDLERDVIAGKLEARNLEEAWNARFEADFGYAVDLPSNGLLQDVHWSCGLWGYFPTYALGNVYAGCLYEALRLARPNLDDELAAGDVSGATGWLRDAVQVHGGLYRPRDLIERASGHVPNEEPLLSYLEGKFG
ncbi:carboxypeptidase M32 [Lentibacter sp. XHP0401]|uniref:carboxypeptidase M32 n=1 Tax=Lentibacter sp. XHP0401 TaxID=2984334 RepID=UPI0021E856C0|nr:carboxypeptidase M32 [Lentibacter sp. XHP0401]MCV2892031.1 carboxypeptidase M32 [Lentibacter sp. XHP0401]